MALIVLMLSTIVSDYSSASSVAVATFVTKGPGNTQITFTMNYNETSSPSL